MKYPIPAKPVLALLFAMLPLAISQAQMTLDEQGDQPMDALESSVSGQDKKGELTPEKGTEPAAASQMAMMAEGGSEGGSGSGGGPASSNNILNFQTDTFTGRFSYSVPIFLPPARGGAQPNLAISYNSANGNGLCGVGWSLEAGSIQRETRNGVPIKWGATAPLQEYDDAKGFMFSLAGVSSRLVSIGNGEYRAEREGAFLKFKYVSSTSWEVTDKSGNKFYFGETTASRMANSKFPAGLGKSTFRWALNRVIDVNGNQTLLEYTLDAGQLYLSKISYNGNVNSPAIAATHTVDFVLETRPDATFSFATGDRVRTAKRLAQVIVKVSGAAVRRYALSYSLSPSTSRSLLDRITQYGSDDTTSLPPLDFFYTEKPLSFASTTDWSGLWSIDLTNPAWSSIRSSQGTTGMVYADLFDMDGDGLPDRVLRKGSAPYTYFDVQRNTGSGFAAPVQWSESAAQSQTGADWNSIRATTGDAAIYVDFADMNRDFLPDRVFRILSAPYTSFMWETNAGTPATAFSNAFYYGTSAINSEVNSAAWRSIAASLSNQQYVGLFDLNGDAMPDRVMRKASSPYNTLKVQLNTNNPSNFSFGTLSDWGPVDTQGVNSPEWGGILGMDADGNVIAAFHDLNGDGLPDRVMRKVNSPYSHFVVQFNNGAGFEPAEAWASLDNQGLAYIGWSSVAGITTGSVYSTLVDMNGDGLPDRVMRKGAAPFDRFVVQLNTGTGFAAAIQWTPVQSEIGTSNAGWQSVSASVYDSTYVDMIDINGDGLVDRVMRKANSPFDRFKVQLNQGPFPDLLETVENGIGGQVDVTYKASTQLNNRDRAFTGDPWAAGAKSLLALPLYTVSTVTTDDGLGAPATTTYSFSGGRYSTEQREFWGFHRVEVTDPLGAKTVTLFHQAGGYDGSADGEYLDANAIGKVGMPYRTEVWGSDGKKYSQTLNKIEQATLNSNQSYFAYISQTIQMEYEGLANYRASAKQFTYSNTTGNLLTESNFGEVSSVNAAAQSFADVGTDSIFTRISYQTLANPDITNKPSAIKVTSDAGGSTRLKERVLGYDPRGNVTSESLWLNTTGGYVSRQMAYDSYGNINSVINPVGITTTTTYDATYKTFPATQTMAGFVTSTTHDARSGALMAATDAKGLVVVTNYDQFFRPTESLTSTAPNGPANLWKQRKSYNLGGIDGSGLSLNYVRTRMNDAVDATNGHESYSYADGLGRGIQTRVEAETGSYRTADTIYDQRGSVVGQTVPYFSTGIANTGWDPSAPRTTITFDPVGRAIVTTPPSGDTGSPTAPETIAYKDGTNPWARVVTDPTGKVKKAYHDAYGRVTQLVEVTATGDQNTWFAYSLLGDLTSVTDNLNNLVTQVSYDSLGRKTGTTDLDMGTWSYLYDDAGRLTRQTDAKNQRIDFAYNDPLGRMTAKEIRDGAGTLVRTVSFTYDTSDDPAYTVYPGQLYKVTDSEGWQKNSYDVRGRVTASTRYLSVNGHQFPVQSTYDDADRVRQLAYPENAATIQYSYDTGGNLSKAESLAGTGANEVFFQPQSYNALGQLSGVTYGNGLQTTYSYYANSKRLQQLKTTKPGGGLHQDLAYSFDAASNIKSITDSIYSGNASSTLSNIQYDDLHRLTSLTSTAQGTKTYSYNSLGNTTVNAEFGAGSYAYATARVHAVTSANGKSYGYDACGNMTARGNQTLTYDEENRLIQVSDGSSTITFGYAHDGTRLWKHNGTNYTIWIGGIYELKSGKALCHVMAGGQRIASFEPISGLGAVMAKTPLVAKVSKGIQTAFDWPFQEGRTPFVATLLPLVGIFAASFTFRRRYGSMIAARPPPRARSLLSTLNPQLSTNRLISALLIVAIFLASSNQQVQAVTYDPVFYYYHSDHLGSSSIITDRAGELVQQYAYTAFGKDRYQANTQSFSLSNRYTGQVLDEETGLYYFNARYYDAELGRFIQPDTVVPEPENPQALNRYSYSGNNPLKYADPSGHFWLEIIVGVLVGAALGAASAAVQGGDVVKGAIGGAVSGLFGGLGGAIGGLAGSVIGGALGGAASAAATGGNIGLSALTGAIAGGIAFGVGQIANKLAVGLTPPQQYYADLGTSALSGGLSGGLSAEIQGGDFAEGVAYGAANSAGIFIVTTGLTTYLTELGDWVAGDGRGGNPADHESFGIAGVRTDRSSAAAMANKIGGIALTNPSQGFINDVMQGIFQMFFFGLGDSLSHQFAAGVAQSRFSRVSLYAHSQGTLIVVNASFQLAAGSVGLIDLSGPAVNYGVAQAAAARQGAGFGWHKNPFDAINIVSPSINPVKTLSGLLDPFTGFRNHSNYPVLGR